MSESLLLIEHLSHQFAKQPILDNINLQLNQGEFLAILGPSGCGKSTLLRAIAGLTDLTEGNISIAGQWVCQQGRHIIAPGKRHVGFVFQDYALFPALTVAENIAFGLKNNQQKKQRVDTLLAMIGLSALADRYPSQLSGGQQQRVAIARALAPKPKLLLLDEPFANVDTEHRQILGEELRILVQRENVGVILVTHDRHEAFSLAERVAILQPQPKGAQISQCDTPENIYQEPINSTVANMSGVISLIACEARGLQAQTAFNSVNLKNPAEGRGHLAVRPEMASWQTDPQGDFEVVAIEFHGCCYYIKCQNRTINSSLRCAVTQKLTLGARGYIQFPQPLWFIAHEHQA